MEVLQYYQLFRKDGGSLSEHANFALQIQNSYIMFVDDEIKSPEVLKERIESMKLGRFSTIIVFLKEGAHLELREVLSSSTSLEQLHGMLYYDQVAGDFVGEHLLQSPVKFPRSLLSLFKRARRKSSMYRLKLNTGRERFLIHLRLLSECLRRGYDGIFSLASSFGSSEELHLFLKTLHFQALADLHPQNEELLAAKEAFTSFEDPANPDGSFISMMNEKPDRFSRLYRISRQVRTPPVIAKGTEAEEFSDEKIIFASTGRLHLRNFKYRSNLSMRSGKIIMTNRRVITYRRRLSLFPSLPFFAFARLNNRMIALLSEVGARVSQIRPVLSGIFRSIGPLAVGFLAIYWQRLIDLDIWARLNLPIIEIPSLSVAIDFAFQNPSIFIAFGGVGTGLYQLFRILFMRSRAITVIKPSMLVGLGTLDEFRRSRSKSPVAVIKPLGSNALPGAQNGLGFRISFRTKSIIPGISAGSFNEVALLHLGMQSLLEH